MTNLGEYQAFGSIESLGNNLIGKWVTQQLVMQMLQHLGIRRRRQRMDRRFIVLDEVTQYRQIVGFGGR